jgi:hypothetical protein
MILPPTQSFDKRRSRIVRVVVAVSIITLLLISIVGMRLVAGIDRQTRDHEEAMVMRGLDLRMTELEQAITPQVDWDDAVIHMSDTMDAHWADSYYAGFMRNMLGATRAFVLDGETDSPMPRGMERAMTRPRPGPLRLLNPPPPNWSPGCAAGKHPKRMSCHWAGRRWPARCMPRRWPGPRARCGC